MKHHHVVMTLPKQLRFLAKLNDTKIHDLLFTLSAKVLTDWFKVKYNIKPGIVSILHTAGADLKFHPHVHMIVSGGGMKLDTKQFVQLPNKYLTRQRYLANKLRDEFILLLDKLIHKHKIVIPNKWIENYDNYTKFKKKLKLKTWIVSIQKPLDDLNQIVGYVGRYSKRTCISEYKLTKLTEQSVSFKFNDYKNTPKGQKTLQSIKTLDINEFFDQLLQHVPKKRYRMVRYYGCYNSHYLSSIPNKQNIKQELTNKNQDIQWTEFEELRKRDIKNGKPDPLLCPKCDILMTFDKIIYPNKHFIDDS